MAGMTYGDPPELQSPRCRCCGPFAAACWLTAALAAGGLVQLGVDAVYVTAWLVAVGWFAAEWTRNAWAWAWAAAAMAVHLVVALGLAHGWSHAHAYAHTAEVSGFGGGIYVSYAVAAVWLLDAILWLATVRRGWLHPLTRLLVAFVMFNATVVYGTPAGKALGGALFGALAARLISPTRQRGDRSGC
jgi:hypothetical protein